MERQIYLVFAVIELSKLLFYQTYYDKLQPYFTGGKIQLHFMDTVSFVSSVNTENVIEDFEILEGIIDLSNSSENQKVFGNKNKKISGHFRTETPKNIGIDESNSLRSKMFAFN